MATKRSRSASANARAADDPQWTNDAAMKEFRAGIARYAPHADPDPIEAMQVAVFEGEAFTCRGR